MENNERPGMKAFRFLWFGQLVSIFGSEMTTFALAIFAWQETGSATALALIPAFSWLPRLLLSPLAGVLVDRSSRKRILILADAGAAAVSLGLLLLFFTGSLEVWQLFLAAVVEGAFSAFQAPAFYASISLLVNKEDYSRASGLMSLANSSSMMLAPVAAAGLLAFISVGNVLAIDLLTFSVAVLTLWLTHIPQPARDPKTFKKLRFWSDIRFGFHYIFSQPSLLGLQTVILSSNFVKTFGTALLIPMVLARTGGNELILSGVQSAAAVGLVAGGVLTSVWRGTRQKIHGVLLSIIITALFSQLLFGLGQGLLWWAVFGFIGSLFRPWTVAAANAIWQSKVEPDRQGRVFATRRVLGQASIPLAYFLAGPLADFVFEPAMMANGGLEPLFGFLVGTGEGAGMALLIVFAGLASALIGLAGYIVYPVRKVETIIPDYDENVTATGQATVSV